jgi:hypothetical protein
MNGKDRRMGCETHYEIGAVVNGLGEVFGYGCGILSVL